MKSEAPEAPETPEAPEDRRVRRTRASLRRALLQLMDERGWDGVRVSEICARADVGRSTFYAHFADKESLLLGGFDDLLHALSASQARSDRAFAFAEELIAHATDHERVFRAMLGRESAAQIQWRFLDVVITLVERDLQRTCIPEADRPATARFLAGGFSALLTAWLDRPGDQPPDALAAQFRRLAVATVEAAQGGQAGWGATLA